MIILIKFFFKEEIEGMFIIWFVLEVILVEDKILDEDMYEVKRDLKFILRKINVFVIGVLRM